MKGGRQEGKVSGQVKNKLSKIHCSASKQKLVEFKLTELRSISFHLVIYYSKENEKAVSGKGLNITLKQKQSGKNMLYESSKFLRQINSNHQTHEKV